MAHTCLASHAVVFRGLELPPPLWGGGNSSPLKTTAWEANTCHGKTYFSTAKLTFSRQNLLFHGKTYSFTAKLTFPRQNLLFHGKTFFSTAKLTFPRQNLLFHGKTYFFLLPESSLSRSAVSRYFRSGNF